MRYGDEDDELAAARAQDRRQVGVPSLMGRGPDETRLLTCTLCGFASSTHRGWRVDLRSPPRGVVCAGRYDETGAVASCFEGQEREQMSRWASEEKEWRQRREVWNQTGTLSAEDRAFIRRQTLAPGTPEEVCRRVEKQLREREEQRRAKSGGGGYQP